LSSLLCITDAAAAAASFTIAIKAAAAILARGTKRERILDVGAGHGTYGLALATQRGTRGDSSHSTSVITALDKPEVLKIAAATAAATPGVTPQRYVQLPGDYITFHSIQLLAVLQ
jgi:methylase of polypeptide subunit release factors